MVIQLPKHYAENAILHGVEFSKHKADVPESVAKIFLEFYGAKEAKKEGNT